MWPLDWIASNIWVAFVTKSKRKLLNVSSLRNWNLNTVDHKQAFPKEAKCLSYSQSNHCFASHCLLSLSLAAAGEGLLTPQVWCSSLWINFCSNILLKILIFLILSFNQGEQYSILCLYHSLSIHALMGIKVFFLPFGYHEKCCYEHECTSTYVSPFSVLWCICLEVESTDHMVILSLTFLWNYQMVF